MFLTLAQYEFEMRFTQINPSSWCVSDKFTHAVSTELFIINYTLRQVSCEGTCTNVTTKRPSCYSSSGENKPPRQIVLSFVKTTSCTCQVNLIFMYKIWQKLASCQYSACPEGLCNVDGLYNQLWITTKTLISYLIILNV